MWLLYMLLFQSEVHPYVNSYLNYKYFGSGSLSTKINDMLNKNSLELLKKVRPSKVESRVLPGT